MTQIDWTWTVLFWISGLLACTYAWRTPNRAIGAGLLGNVALTTAAALYLPPEALLGVNVVVEIMMMVLAFTCLFETRAVPVAVITLSVVSCTCSLAFSSEDYDASIMVRYEEVVNALYVMACFITIMTGLWSVVGHRARTGRRWRIHRRHAADASRRFQLASKAAPWGHGPEGDA